ncbi:hypothetical protein EMIHUDRAFT_114050 [Emiliania huxleyi CCMP1516]|uniref:Uncharacterized protein n=2 Tax=Emiliania huxleyi TaxID=2903 RepID=A0A0D3JZ23_EMIH1|nr:hypothetical protein EMIHUDRAFT_114050 [Emiliania huxleyi CCMP1516]EOD28758.1 hypothetical protein EMIHUDRAFT_114050 [Emiliania huxleyi CCMP1516]|eukprot:XP_005781187.1 hypothetical protein EMIHUDRAFT_114050 [Emiliania huxleyi CCMP1516]
MDARPRGRKRTCPEDHGYHPYGEVDASQRRWYYNAEFNHRVRLREFGPAPLSSQQNKARLRPIHKYLREYMQRLQSLQAELFPVAVARDVDTLAASFDALQPPPAVPPLLPRSAPQVVLHCPQLAACCAELFSAGVPVGPCPPVPSPPQPPPPPPPQLAAPALPPLPLSAPIAVQESESEEEVEAEVEAPGKEGGRVKVEMGAGDTSDVEEVAPPPPPPRTALAARDGEQEVQATASTGGLLNLPHARALCPSAPFRAPQGAFAKRPLHGNAEACPRCYCYICDAPARECTQWQSDYRNAPSHCNAHDRLTKWRKLRDGAKRKRQCAVAV